MFFRKFLKILSQFRVINISTKKRRELMRIKDTVNNLIEEAINERASDIFFLLQRNKLVVNFRQLPE